MNLTITKQNQETQRKERTAILPPRIKLSTLLNAQRNTIRNNKLEATGKQVILCDICLNIVIL